MERNYSSNEEALAVAKEVMWLAWVAAGGPSGAGFLRDKPGADKEAVWKNAYNNEDYSGRRHGPAEQVSADYVFGRMLKLTFRVKGNTITHRDEEPRWDYQSWCGKYKTYAALFDAAETAVLQKAA
jgi:hypothetical protein